MIIANVHHALNIRPDGSHILIDGTHHRGGHAQAPVEKGLSIARSSAEILCQKVNMKW